MYKQVKTTKEITMSVSKGIVNPVETLESESGGVCQIFKDDHCYVICLKQDDGTYRYTPYIFKEVFEVLKTLPSPM